MFSRFSLTVCTSLMFGLGADPLYLQQTGTYPASVTLKSPTQPPGVVHTTLTQVQGFGHLLKGTSEAHEMGIIQKVGPVFLVFNKETWSDFGATCIKKRVGTCLHYRGPEPALHLQRWLERCRRQDTRCWVFKAGCQRKSFNERNRIPKHNTPAKLCDPHFHSPWALLTSSGCKFESSPTDVH